MYMPITVLFFNLFSFLFIGFSLFSFNIPFFFFGFELYWFVKFVIQKGKNGSRRCKKSKDLSSLLFLVINRRCS